MILGVAFVWFTTHFGGGFASGAQIYSYYVRYGIWSLFLPLFAMAYNGVFFAYCLYFARKHEVYDYRSYNNAFYGRFAPLFSNLFELLYLCVMCVAPAVAFATGGATLSTLTGLPYLLCTFVIGAFIFVVSVFGTDLVRKVASVLSICIIAGLLIVYVPNIIAGAGKIGDTVNAMKTAGCRKEHGSRCRIKCPSDDHGRPRNHDRIPEPGNEPAERPDIIYGSAGRRQ